MIGFKIDVAYLDSFYPFINNFTNISQLNFVEKDRYFTICTTYKDGVLSTQIGRYASDYTAWYKYGAGQDGQTKMLLALQEALGSDFNRIYCFPWKEPGDRGAQLNYMLRLMPSIPLMYPYLWDDSLDTFNCTIVCYFKTLKKLYFKYQSGTGELRIYDVSDDGSVSLRLTSVPSYDIYPPKSINMSSGSATFILAIKNYQDGMDLSIGSNYVTIGFNAYPDQYHNASMITTNPNSTQASQFFQALFSKDTKPDTTFSDGPYDQGGSSGEGDYPPGTFDDTSDPIPDSELPTLSASDTGFTRIYNPTLSQVQALAKYLWTDDSILETIWNHVKQYFEDPMQAIIGFNLVPCAVPDGGNREFALMYIGTGVYMNAAASQFVDVDCGSLELERYYGSALDQAPYTKVSCFLPYIGMVDLNTDEVMGATLSVKYRIDIVSGSCVAKILVDGNVLYQYSGHCAISIPISSADFTSYVSAAISVAKLAVAGAAAGAGAALAATASSMAAQETGHIISSASQSITPMPQALVPQGAPGRGPAPAQLDNNIGGGTGASFSGLPPANVTNTVGEIMGSKPTIQHSGSFSGNSGYLGVRRPFIIIERPNMCMPENYQQLNGFPCMITLKLGDCTGYTRVQQVQLTGIKATNPEQSELLSLLKTGVIL